MKTSQYSSHYLEDSALELVRLLPLLAVLALLLLASPFLYSRVNEPLFLGLDRLMDRPSVARTIDAARPFFQYYPGRSGLSRRFFEPEGS